MITDLQKKMINKIDADDRTISQLLKDQKFTIDYFQREYKWKDKNIRALIEDLTTTFFKSYDPSHKRSDVQNYQNYYLGPVVLIQNTDGVKSIIDGQQRITSLSLLLIYLNNLQKDFKNGKVNVTDLIFSEKFGVKSFNLSDDNREELLTSLFETGQYEIQETDDDTVSNMYERYLDISDSFPDELSTEALPYFIDWLKENVILIEITAYSEENAYLIFETMNDRGLNLTQSEMLKGFILSKIKVATQRAEITDLWKKEMQKLNKLGNDTELSFFQAWFRGKYAVSIRPGKAGSENQDFENIGSIFHKWFKENHEKLFKLKSSDDFYNFCKIHLPFYIKWYINIKTSQHKYNPKLPQLAYIGKWGIADSLQEPMLLSPLNHFDTEDIANKKLTFVAHYIENFTVRRAVNYRKFGQTAIKYTMFTTIKAIRNNDINILGENLAKAINEIPEKFSAIQNFGLHGMNKNFVKHLLCRMTSYVDQAVGKDVSYAAYQNPVGKQFQIEHLWADKFERHTDEFEQKGDFAKYRNLIGAMILLPAGTNQSFSSDIYEDKLTYYLRENTYAQTLHKDFYQRNPNFHNADKVKNVGFKNYPQLHKQDIIERNKIVQNLCEKIWSPEFLLQ